MLKMTSDREGITESGRKIQIGTTVTYICHVVGGMVRVCLEDGTEEIMHPNCFKELR